MNVIDDNFNFISFTPSDATNLTPVIIKPLKEPKNIMTYKELIEKYSIDPKS